MAKPDSRISRALRSVRHSLFSVLLLAGCPSLTRAVAQDRHEFTAVHMGVPVRIVMYAPDTASARGAARAAFARIAALENIMSDYRPRSELRLLAEQPREWVPVSPELLAVLNRAVEIARLTGGAFDPTVGPLVALWREARRAGRLPDKAALARARERVGWMLLSVDVERRQVRLAVDSMQLDLGGIAKGFILQEALTALRAHGVSTALVEAGGDVVAGDAPPGQLGWEIEVAGADDEVTARARILSNSTIATSGATEQFVEIDGVRYSHVIDPRTGLGVTGSHVVTVIASDGALADAVATAAGVLGPGSAAMLSGRFPGMVLGFRVPVP
ncbi:MAG TPA: FAD:protein FMN transferase [Gemmatimonadaceae bacterium]